MKFALIGYGKMGQMVKRHALMLGHEIAAVISPHHPRATHRTLSAASVDAADVCIDFSTPSAAPATIMQLAAWKKPMVIGTTGWYEQLPKLKEILATAQVGMIYSPNFSIGVQMFLKIVSAAAQQLAHFPDYDVCLQEVHHNQKADSPSGTALAIAKTLMQELPWKKTLLCDTPLGKRPEDALQISSVRCGNIPGTHTVLFNSTTDTLTLTHQAHNREGFAKGAIAAAEWIVKRQGVFTMGDLLP